jgi:hypothetical protein
MESSSSPSPPLATVGRIHWVRVLLAVIAAEILPIIALVIVVVIYSLVRTPESPSPEAFAPQAGNWVGPIGGFLSVLLFSFLSARSASKYPFAHGLAVGLGTAALDFALGLSMGGGSMIAILVASNCGRVLAGAFGGVLGGRWRHRT